MLCGLIYSFKSKWEDKKANRLSGDEKMNDLPSKEFKLQFSISEENQSREAFRSSI